MFKRKLLLADDSITIQKVVNLTFADEGIEVITVDDGSKVLEKVYESKPDLILAYVNLPEKNGYEICESIKKNEETKHIPFILLVGSFETFDQIRAQEVGADDYLTKPFQSIRQLADKVAGYLNLGGINTNSDDFEVLETPPESGVLKFGLSDSEEKKEEDEIIQFENYSSFDLAGFNNTGKNENAVLNPDSENEDLFPLEGNEANNFEQETDQNSFADQEKSFELDLLDEHKFSAEKEIDSSEFSKADPEFSAQLNSKENTSEINLDNSQLLEIPVKNVSDNFENNINDRENNSLINVENSPNILSTAEDNLTKEEKAKRFSAVDFPPEVIEAIADRVVEKLTQKLKI